VVALRSTTIPPWRISIAAGDGTILYGKGVRLTAERVGLKEISDVGLPASEVLEITRTD